MYENVFSSVAASVGLCPVLQYREPELEAMLDQVLPRPAPPASINAPPWIHPPVPIKLCRRLCWALTCC